MLHHIIYKNENPNAEWIVFIHGAGGSSTIWFKQINAFRKEYNLLLVDLRGHGRTIVDDKINKNFLRDNLAVFIENLIKKKEDIDMVLIESHGYTDVSNVFFYFLK